MVEINLLPKELRQRRKKETAAAAPPAGVTVSARMAKLAKIKPKVLIIAAAAIIVISQALLVGLQLFGRMRLAALRARYETLTVQLKDVNTLKGSIEVIAKKAPLLDPVLRRKFSWTEKLNALSNSVTSGVWLTQLSYGERAETPGARRRGSGAPGGRVAYIELSGFVYSVDEDLTSCVDRFIKSLKGNPSFSSDFSTISVVDIKGDRYDGYETMAFRILCSFGE